MKILTFNWHEGYIHLLAKTGYEFDVVEVQKGGRYGWIKEFRTVPQNCNLITEDDARSRLNAGYYDRIICHNINDLLFVHKSPIHKVLIFHNKLSCEIALGGNAVNKEEYLRQVRGLFDAAKNLTLVFISKAKRDDWGLDGEIILPGIDIFEYGDWKGDVKNVLRVGNLLKERDIMLGYFVQERLLSDISFTILGLNPNISDSYLPKDWDEFKKHMRTHRVYLNTTLAPYEDGYNLAMLEAMATGMPVVSIANPTSPIEDSVNGFISDDEDYLRERIIELLKDHSLSKSIGQKARETVIEKFPIERFIGEWKRVLGDSTGFQCHSVDLKCRICESKAKLFYKSDRKFYRCPNCLLIFTENILEKKDCERHYKAQWETVDEGFWRNQADAVLNIVHQYIIPHRILDFGAGSGGLTKELIRRGLDVVSFEPMLHGDFKAKNFANKFDVVVAMEVIEHIESIYQVLEDIEKVLSKDGVIFFSTCLTDKFIYESNAVEQFQHWWYKDDLTHVNYFCRNAVKKLAQVLKYNVDFYGDNVFVLSRSGKIRREDTSIYANKEMKNFKILLSYTSNPATTAVYIEKAMRKSHDVITYGPAISDDTLKAWNLEAIKDRVKDHDIPYFTPDLKVVLKHLPDGWTPDVFLWVESGIKYPMEGLKDLPCLKACYLIDTHIHFDKHIKIAKDFDYVFLAQKAYVPGFKEAGIENVFWLPLASDPEIHTPPYPPLLRGELKGGKKLYDIGFVGTLIDPKRIKLLNKLKERFNVHYERCFLERMAEVFSQSRIVFNNSINNDLNMRVFEAMASGSMLLTDEAKGSGLTELFKDRKHLVIYRNEEELLELADYYLKSDKEREEIAEAGMKETLAKHTYEHRVKEMIEVIAKGGLGGICTLEQDNSDYYAQERKDIESLVPNGVMKILDIGCGEGTLGKRLLKKGIREVIGIEINPDACKNAGHNLSRVICGDIEEIELPFSEGYFDCIICGDVLEHLKDPLRVLKKIRSYLSDAGAIVASIPNVRYYGIINMLTEGRWKYGDYGILDRAHLRFFTKKEIEELFYDAGFEITGITENIDHRYNNINPLSQNVSFGRVTLNRLHPDELKDLFVFQYLIRAQKVRHALHAEPGNLEDQKTELEEYLNAHPADLNMLYKYAEICHKLGFKEKALESLERILIFEPEREDAIELREKMVDLK